MNKHTPGPWKIDVRECVIWITAPDQKEPLYLLPRYGSPTVRENKTQDEIKANAQLISAAAEMLEVLGFCLIAIENGCASKNDEEGLFDIIKNVIAKAEGRNL